jgi:hypothetical protein
VVKTYPLSVTIPSDAETGDTDTITVTATFQEDPEKKGSDSCKVVTIMDEPGPGEKVTLRVAWAKPIAGGEDWQG